MTRVKSANLVRDFAALFQSGTLAGLGDGQLVERFIIDRDEGAFEELIARHGPMVLGICKRSLEDPTDIEDPFQATFLILVRKARSLRDRVAVSSWLYGVALRVTRRARAHAQRRRALDRPIVDEHVGRGQSLVEPDREEVLAIIDQEIRRLPERQQIAAILCLSEGWTHEAAAQQLGLPLGTMKGRVAAARRTLMRRLSRRGITPSVMMLGLPSAGGGLPMCPIPAKLVRNTLQVALESITGVAVPVVSASGSVAGLVREVLVLAAVARIPSLALVGVALGTLAWGSAGFFGEQAGNPQARSGAGSGVAAPAPMPRIDFYGDPLPPGAVMRLGTVRFRQQDGIEQIIYPPDGRFLLTNIGRQRLQVWDARDGRKKRELEFGLVLIRDFAFSPDGQFLVTAGRVDHRQALIFTEFATGREVGRSVGGVEHTVTDLAFSPDGRMIATVDGSSDVLRIWNVRGKRPIFEKALMSQAKGVGRERLWRVMFSPDPASHLLAVAGHTLHLWDVDTCREVRQFKDPAGSRPWRFAFSADGKMIATPIGFDGAIQLWRVADGAAMERLSGKNRSIASLCFSPEGDVLATTGQQGHLAIWDLKTGQESEPFDAEGLATGPIAFSPDGRTIAATGAEPVVHLWDRENGKDRLATPEAHMGPVQALLFADGGRTLISGSDDRTARIWDLSGDLSQRERQRASLKHAGWVRAMALSPNQLWLATGSCYPENQAVHIWHLPTGQLRRTFSGSDKLPSPIGMRFSNDGQSISVCWSDGSLRGWDLTTAQELALTQPAFLEGRPNFPGNFGRTAIFSPDGSRLGLLAGGSGSLRVAGLPSGRELFAIPRAHVAVFSPDGLVMAIAEMAAYRDIKLADGTMRNEFAPNIVVHFVDATTGREFRKILVEGASLVEALAFSPDGKMVAVGPGWNDSRIQIYDVSTGSQLQTIATPAGTHGTLAMAFTPDGRRLVMGMSDTSILFWKIR